ncbi:LAME_0H04874g1_1 [Lachancea meyersii CBS 8951]|uniref:LAME_0H04874g1_1 n=1 Tax=Lachancea meyersii CBS 8951 TaxID=1266667 RepID=A0A1G4KE42_9SACH|nr:LAME_0H04874g1_1 [Lachancea meyersii CBS 8951]
MKVLTPNELVERICEEIAYAGGSLTSGPFWDVVSEITDNLDNRLRSFVLRCFGTYQDTSIMRHGKLLAADDFDEQTIGSEDLTFSISEDRLFLFLTGYKKKECSVGGLAFELLLEIAKTKEQGINTMDLARKTSQDPRSITGRIKKLGNLVSGVQTIYKGHVVKHLRFHRFGVREDSNKGYASMKDSLQSIVEVVKNSKNGVRQVIDLKREFKFDKDKRLSKAFIAAISSLDAAGYLKKVLVISPSNPAIKIRCVKFLKDYEPEERPLNESEDDSDIDEENEESPGNDDGAGEDEENYSLLNAENASQLLQSKNLLVEDDMNTELKRFLLNRFYPLQNQTFGLVDKEGTAGLSSMQGVNMLTGNDYKRSFTKCSEYYIDTVGKEKEDSEGFGLVKVYDFEGKRKFYRLFTKPNFKLLTSAATRDEDSGFRPLKPQHRSLKELNNDNFFPLSNTLRFMHSSDGDVFFWNGELKAPANENAAPRGRKRKQAKVGELQHDEASKKVKSRESALPAEGVVKSQKEPLQDLLSTAHFTESDAGVSVTDEDNGDRGRATLSIGGFSANSLKSLHRQRAILGTIKKLGGVTIFRDQFFEEVTKLMGSKTTLDKKTIKGDIELLKAVKKIGSDIDKRTGRKVIYLPNTTSKAISTYLNNEKDNKKSYFNDVIEGTDIYFFDSDQRERFLSGTKSAERIKNFDKKAKSGKPAQSVTRRSEKKAEKSSTKVVSSLRDSTAERQSLVQSNMAQQASKEKADRQSYNVGTKVGLRVLVMSVVLTELVKGEIAWNLVTKLFPNNSLSNLEKQWTLRRIKMGLGGLKALKMKWRKILVNAMKEERTTMEDIESLDLPKLISLWQGAEQKLPERPTELLRNYEENFKKSTFIKDAASLVGTTSLDLSSMIQRESTLLRKCYTYELGKIKRTSGEEENIKTIVRSALLDKNSAAVADIEALKDFDVKDVDRIILDMAKDKQLTFMASSKLQLSDGFAELLKKKGEFENLEKAATYIKQLQVVLRGKQGIVLKEELVNHAAIVYVDMLQSKTISINPVPVSSHELPMHYTTRKYGFDALMPPLIVSCRKPVDQKNVLSSRIPLGKPCSRLWINGDGALRGEIWKQLVSLVLNEVFFNPGVSTDAVATRNARLISPREVEEVVSWCFESKLIVPTKLRGLIATSTWYAAF